MASFTTNYSYINDNTWKQVSTNNPNVKIINNISVPIQVAVALADTDLAAVTGHEVLYKEDMDFEYLATGQNVFVKSVNGVGNFTVTAY